MNSVSVIISIVPVTIERSVLAMEYAIVDNAPVNQDGLVR